MKPKSIEESQKSKEDLRAFFMAYAVAGQTIIRGLSHIPWFYLARVEAKELIEIVNDAVEAYWSKWKRD